MLQYNEVKLRAISADNLYISSRPLINRQEIHESKKKRPEMASFFLSWICSSKRRFG